LQALSDQMALTLTNILATERLRTLYLANIERHERERSHLALVLHDEVLNEMAALAMSLGEQVLTPQFQTSYETLITRLRQMIVRLRPAMLRYGLHLALEELVDEVAARAQDGQTLELEVSSDETRYPPDIEQHLFRIVQQATENAWRHAEAATIRIGGQIGSNGVNLYVEDDGVGFQAGTDLDLLTLLEHRHFGLANMFERATLIGANVRIRSGLGNGTQVQITWRPDDSPDND
jgi:signal transduction histidine kinase